MHIDEKRAHRFGFGKNEIQSLLQKAFGKEAIGSIRNGVFTEDIFVELLPKYQSTKDAPSKLYLTSLNGDTIPLKAVASWEEKFGVSRLNRSEGLPSVRLRFSLPQNISSNVGLERVEKAAAKMLPENMSVALTGSAKAIASTMRNTLLLLLASVVVMYIILGVLYESFIHPLTILSSIPFACLGGVLTLFLANEPLSIFSAVGFLLLIGIVKKNGIMMVDCAIELQKTGVCVQEAIYESCLIRFRPIMMTTIAAIMGAVPLAIGVGESAEMLRGLGLVIVGGLVFSQVLSLYVTPVLYRIFSKKDNRMKV
jgi:HAE1 family hydrophobic/amphiphilic exporter-1